MSAKILVVDDSPTMRRIIINALNKIGYSDIGEASNGKEALDTLRSEEYKLILTDWNMPEMTGEQFVRELMQDEKLKSIPVIMVTTRGMKEDVITAVKLGVRGYIVKPFTPEVLKEKIEEVLGA
ncbi:MAG: two-component system response regulator [Candidatus Neomarinimicrobiota bacterium]|nr:response regulator [Candidatus Neomarinimicrobiota bacterium]RKY50338.1 MAG: two-component system response regulator [Candidatus Neomarinimicrobiota bacterium]